MLVRLVIIAVFIAILASLFSGMYFMLHDKSNSTRNVQVAQHPHRPVVAAVRALGRSLRLRLHQA